MKSVATSILMLIVACGGAPAGSQATSTPPIASTQVDDVTTVPGDATTVAPGDSATTNDRLEAPDFTLELGDGGTYTLSESAKPVYLVFWAEW